MTTCLSACMLTYLRLFICLSTCFCAFISPPVYLSLCLFMLLVCLSICMPDCVFTFRLSVWLSVCLDVCICVDSGCTCLSVSWSVYLPVCQLVCLFVDSFVYLSVCLYICLSAIRSVCLSINKQQSIRRKTMFHLGVHCERGTWRNDAVTSAGYRQTWSRDSGHSCRCRSRSQASGNWGTHRKIHRQ